MSNFIKVTDAITGNHILIKTDLIATIEQSIKHIAGQSLAVSRIIFVDDRFDEYVTEDLHYFETLLINS